MINSKYVKFSLSKILSNVIHPINKMKRQRSICHKICFFHPAYKRIMIKKSKKSKNNSIRRKSTSITVD